MRKGSRQRRAHLAEQGPLPARHRRLHAGPGAVQSLRRPTASSRTPLPAQHGGKLGTANRKSATPLFPAHPRQEAEQARNVERTASPGIPRAAQAEKRAAHGAFASLYSGGISRETERHVRHRAQPPRPQQLVVPAGLLLHKRVPFFSEKIKLLVEKQHDLEERSSSCELTAPQRRWACMIRAVRPDSLFNNLLSLFLSLLHFHSHHLEFQLAEQ